MYSKSATVLFFISLKISYDNTIVAEIPKVTLNDGNLIPVVGLGTAKLRNESILNAIDYGYRLFDSAYFYKTEKIVGDVVNEAISDGKVKREEIFFVSKVWPTFYSKGRVIKSAKQSIEECGLKYLDLLLLHWPIGLIDDDNEMFPKLANGDLALADYDIIDVYRELEEVKRIGLTKSIGVSNFNSEQIERIVKIAEYIPVTNQVECHPYLNQEKLLNFCSKYNITLTAHSPLGSRYSNPDKPSVFDDKTLQSIADKHNKTVAQVMIRWQTQRRVIVIPRSSNKERIKENIDVFDFALSDDDMASINSLNRNLRYFDLKSFGFAAHKEYPFNIEF